MLQRLFGQVGLVAANAACTGVRAAMACGNVAAVAPKRAVWVALAVGAAACAASEAGRVPMVAHIAVGAAAGADVLAAVLRSERKQQ